MDASYSAEMGFVFASPLAWIIGLVFAWSYTGSPSHSIIFKGAGWVIGFPAALIVGNLIGSALTPHWYAWFAQAYFGGYGFLAVWVAIAVFGDEDRLEDFIDKIKESANGTAKKPKHSRQKSSSSVFRAPD